MNPTVYESSLLLFQALLSGGHRTNLIIKYIENKKKFWQKELSVIFFISVADLLIVCEIMYTLPSTLFFALTCYCCHSNGSWKINLIVSGRFYSF